MFESRLMSKTKFHDPVVLIRKDAVRILCDCGRMEDLKEIAKVDLLLISHTHMDHFSGFDDVMRQGFGTGKVLRVFGPRHLTDQVRHKINAYTWNVADPDSLHITVNEIHDSSIARTDFTIPQNTAGEAVETIPLDNDIIYKGNDFTIRYLELDHHMPCFAYRIAENDMLKINSKMLRSEGLKSGPWLEELKNHIAANNPDTLLSAHGKEIRVGDLAHIVYEKKGDVLVYLTDFHPGDHYGKIVSFAGEARLLYLESYFRDRDSELGGKNRHLTTTDAGRIARDAAAQEVVVMHFSNRYRGEEDKMMEEVRKHLDLKTQKLD